MRNILQPLIEKIYSGFKKDASKMLIYTGVAGWTLSSLAQIFAIAVNPKISKDKKHFLIPQEFSDAMVNIGAFFLVTKGTQKLVSKLFSTGKIAPKSVRAFLDKNKELYGNKVGKVDFDLDKVRKTTNLFPEEDYFACKNFGTTLATVGAGIVSSNIITPIMRNRMAAKAQNTYLQKKSIGEDANKPMSQNTAFRALNQNLYHNSGNMRI